MYRFILGGPGSGKSNKVFTDCISAAMADESSHFLLITPEQSTTRAEKEIIRLHPCHATDNIDVVSFSRLAYRVFRELGIENPQILSDIEKAMILRRIGYAHRGELRIWGSRFDKPGFVDNLKSMISELYQYGIEPDSLKTDEAFGSRLNNKLCDLKLIYSEFKKEIGDKYIAAEEIPDILARNIHRSGMIRGSVIILDGFTGFTPIQYRIVRGFLEYAKEVIVTVSIGEDKEHPLFGMSREMIDSICRLGDETRVIRGADTVLTTDSFMEKHILRHDGAVYHHAQAAKLTEVSDAATAYSKADDTGISGRGASDAVKDVISGAEIQKAGRADAEQEDTVKPATPGKAALLPRIVRACSMQEEAEFICSSIESLVKLDNLRYRDIAVVCSDQEAYGKLLAHQMEVSGIPSYMDETIGISDNALVMMITGALDVIHTDYSYESFVRYLKSGLPEENEDMIFVLDNYIYECGRRGYRRMSGSWDYMPEDLKDMDRGVLNDYKNEVLDRLEALRRLFTSGKAPVPEIVDTVTALMRRCNVQDKLEALRDEFAAGSDRCREREYAKVYESVENILRDMKDLLKDEEMGADEFSRIFSAGIEQVKLGVLPSGADRVIIGDLTRSRIDGIKVLFVAGANEGLLPKLLNRKNVITDTEKEMLKAAGYELAPTAKEDLLIQRYYIYRIFSKPSRQLIISYAGLDISGKAMRPSYITVHLMKLYPQVKTEDAAASIRILNVNSAVSLIGDRLRELRINGIGERDRTFEELYAYLRDKEDKRTALITEAALYSYRPEKLSRESIDLLYGDILFSSVSRLETYAKCPYQYFARYGLGLKEIEEFTFRAIDIGNIAHGALEKIFVKAGKNDIDLHSLTEEERSLLVKESIDQALLDDEGSKYTDSARNQYIVKRVERVVSRSLWGLLKNLDDSYRPYELEWPFSSKNHLSAARLDIGAGRVMELSGKIDRTDIDESDPGKTGVRIIDYKSGNKTWDLNDVINGNDLQITMYMAAVQELLGQRFHGREIVPEQMYYYTVQDPIVDKDRISADRSVEDEIKDQMGFAGVNTREEIEMLIPYVKHKAEGIGRSIVSGEIKAAPKLRGSGYSSCSFCAYRSVCGFDRKIEGCRMKAEKKYSKDEQWQIISGQKNS